MRLWGLIFVLMANVSQAATTASPPVDCEHARYTPDTTICHDPALKTQDRVIAADYDRMLTRYRGEARATFATGQALWHIAVNDCRNRTDPKLIRACIATRFSEREVLLTKLAGDPAKLATSVADYGFVHPVYLLKFAHQYNGKVVSVSGGITIEACDAKKKASLKGRLDNMLEVRFKSLSEDQIEFLCEQRPFSWWDGTVRFDGAQPYLYAVDVLGVKLP